MNGRGYDLKEKKKRREEKPSGHPQRESIPHFFYNVHPKHEHSMEHSSIVSDNVVEGPSSMAEKIASGDYEVLSSARNYRPSR